MCHIVMECEFYGATSSQAKGQFGSEWDSTSHNFKFCSKTSLIDFYLSDLFANFNIDLQLIGYQKKAQNQSEIFVRQTFHQTVETLF